MKKSWWLGLALGLTQLLGAEGVGPYGRANLLVNPEFKQGSIAAASNNGNWGWFKDGKVSVNGWTGGGNAGVAINKDMSTWRPYLPQQDNYRVFLQMQNTNDDSAFIEQSVSVATSGNYAFSCQYSTRYNWNSPGSFGLRVTVDGTATELDTIAFAKTDTFYQYTTWYVPMTAGKTYTFRLHGLKGVASDHTAMIGSCALEYLPTADRQIGTDYHLTADEDWSAQSVAIDPGVKVYLDGHNLRIGAVHTTARGTLPTFTDESEHPGELQYVLAAGATQFCYGYSVEGKVKVVKSGEGRLVWNGGTIADTAPMLVTNGVFQVGGSHPNLFGTGGTVTVMEPGQFDVHHCNGFGGAKAPSYARNFFVQGAGPDGSGAIVNDLPNTCIFANVTVGGYHLNQVTLTGDATIGGTSRVDFRGTGPGVNAEGYTLTIKNRECAVFCAGTAYVRADNVLVTDGGVFQPCNDGCEITLTGDILLNGGTLATWAPAGNKSTMLLNNPVVVSGQGGVFRSDYYWYSQEKPLTIRTGSTLEIGGGCGWQSVVTNQVGATIYATNSACCVRMKHKLVNAGLVEHGGGEFRFGFHDNANTLCEVENSGVIRSRGGNFYFNTASTMAGAGLLEIAGGTANLAGGFADYTGTIRLAGGSTSFGKLDTFTGTLKLAGGKVTSSLAGVAGPVVFDLAQMETSVAVEELGWTTLPAAQPVTVLLEGRDLQPGDKLLSWTQVPNLVFTLDAVTAAKGQSLVSTAAGLYYGADPDSPDAVSATWTGAAGNGEYNDAGNWVCTNAASRVIANGVPNRETIITLGADVPAGGWQEFLVDQQVGSIELNGHIAYIPGKEGVNASTFIIKDTSTDTTRPGEVHFRIGAGTNFTKNANITITGNLRLVADGEGQFIWGGGTLAASIPIVVSNGYFKVGVNTADVFGAGGTVTVANRGQFNIAYGAAFANSPVFKREFFIEGEGPDGNGAIINSGNGVSAAFHLSHVVMTDNATLGGSSRIDFRGRGPGIDGEGLTLTIKNTQMVAFCGGTAYLNVSNVVVTDRGVIEPCSDGCVMRVKDDIRLENGGILATWSAKNVTYAFEVPVSVGVGGGLIRSDNYWSSLRKPITVLTGGELTFGAGGAPWYSTLETQAGGTINVGQGTQWVGGGYLNNGAFVQTGGDFKMNSKLTNNGTMKTSGGSFLLASEQQVEGTGTLELAGGTPNVAATLTGYAGEIRLTGGTATIAQIGTFNGTMRLRDGVMATSLAGLPGRAVIDVTGRELPYDIEGKNWLTFSSGKRVDVEVGDCVFKNGDQVLAWTTAPDTLSGVTFKLTNGQLGTLEKRSDGLYYACGVVIYIR